MNVVEFSYWMRLFIYAAIGLMALHNAIYSSGMMQAYRILVGVMFLSLAVSVGLRVTGTAYVDWWAGIVNTPLAWGILVCELALMHRARKENGNGNGR